MGQTEGHPLGKSTPSAPGARLHGGRALPGPPGEAVLPGVQQELRANRGRGRACKCLSFARQVSKTTRMLLTRTVFKTRSEDGAEGVGSRAVFRTCGLFYNLPLYARLNISTPALV